MYVCEACRSSVAECIESSSTDGHTFYLCVSCRERLCRHTLPPVYWLNLASIHTEQVFELGENFYGVHGESFAGGHESTWSLDGFRTDLTRLFDVLVARAGEIGAYEDGPVALEYIRAFPDELVEAEFEKRLASARNPHARRALIRSAAHGVLPMAAAVRVASRIRSLVSRDDLSEWMALASGRLEWGLIREKFFEVVRATGADQRRFLGGDLDGLLEGCHRDARWIATLEFFRLIPHVHVGQLLARYLDLIDARDRHALVAELFVEAIRSMCLSERRGDATAQVDMQAWCWGEVAASCDADWCVKFFGHERGCWSIVVSAAAIASGRHPDDTSPAVETALKADNTLGERWRRAEMKLKALGKWSSWK
jgi:hypothetical protein